MPFKPLVNLGPMKLERASNIICRLFGVPSRFGCLANFEQRREGALLGSQGSPEAFCASGALKGTIRRSAILRPNPWGLELCGSSLTVQPTSTGSMSRFKEAGGYIQALNVHDSGAMSTDNVHHLADSVHHVGIHGVRIQAQEGPMRWTSTQQLLTTPNREFSDLRLVPAKCVKPLRDLEAYSGGCYIEIALNLLLLSIYSWLRRKRKRIWRSEEALPNGCASFHDRGILEGNRLNFYDGI
ncbi:hypothetical protein DFH09DRAFT_1279042 [Mycena vulgaris]|nr:hypothetical protein DFH09DRAFT_1279042 [Mycena vulgaris]